MSIVACLNMRMRAPLTVQTGGGIICFNMRMRAPLTVETNVSIILVLQHVNESPSSMLETDVSIIFPKSKYELCPGYNIGETLLSFFQYVK